jgi:hypothetical protein
MLSPEVRAGQLEGELPPVPELAHIRTDRWEIRPVGLEDVDVGSQAGLGVHRSQISFRARLSVPAKWRG